MSTVFFNLRIDEKLNERLAEIAAEEGRSKNKQIEYILKEYVKNYFRSDNEITANLIRNKDAQEEPQK